MSVLKRLNSLAKRRPAYDLAGQGLNDLYVRFFRMAERRIAEKTGQGVVCFISNYSWLDGLSFTGVRERYLEAFDTVRIDNPHGDRIVSEYAPTGRTPQPGGPAKRSLRFKVNCQALKLVRASRCYRRRPPLHRQAIVCCTAISIKQGPRQGARRCWTVLTLPQSIPAIQR